MLRSFLDCGLGMPTSPDRPSPAGPLLLGWLSLWEMFLVFSGPPGMGEPSLPGPPLSGAEWSPPPSFPGGGAMLWLPPPPGSGLPSVGLALGGEAGGSVWGFGVGPGFTGCGW